MRTEKQIAASRANGARSRGPKSTRIAAVHAGDYKTLGRAILHEGESRHGFEDLVSEIVAWMKPESPIDHILIGKMLAAHWRQLRLWYREKEGGNYLGADETRLDRQFYRAFDRYFKLRAPSPGSESTNDTIEGLYPSSEPAPKPAVEPTETHREPSQNADLCVPESSANLPPVDDKSIRLFDPLEGAIIV